MKKLPITVLLKLNWDMGCNCSSKIVLHACVAEEAGEGRSHLCNVSVVSLQQIFIHTCSGG